MVDVKYLRGSGGRLSSHHPDPGKVPLSAPLSFTRTRTLRNPPLLIPPRTSPDALHAYYQRLHGSDKLSAREAEVLLREIAIARREADLREQEKDMLAWARALDARSPTPGNSEATLVRLREHFDGAYYGGPYPTAPEPLVALSAVHVLLARWALAQVAVVGPLAECKRVLVLSWYRWGTPAEVERWWATGERVEREGEPERVWRTLEECKALHLAKEKADSAYLPPHASAYSRQQMLTFTTEDLLELWERTIVRVLASRKQGQSILRRAFRTSHPVDPEYFGQSR